MWPRWQEPLSNIIDVLVFVIKHISAQIGYSYVAITIIDIIIENLQLNLNNWPKQIIFDSVVEVSRWSIEGGYSTLSFSIVNQYFSWARLFDTIIK